MIFTCRLAAVSRQVIFHRIAVGRRGGSDLSIIAAAFSARPPTRLPLNRRSVITLGRAMGGGIEKRPVQRFHSPVVRLRVLLMMMMMMLQVWVLLLLLRRR